MCQILCDVMLEDDALLRFMPCDALPQKLVTAYTKQQQREASGVGCALQLQTTTMTPAG